MALVLQFRAPVKLYTPSVAVALLLSGAPLLACASDSDDDKDTIATARSALPRDRTPNVSPADQAQLIADNTAFAFDLYNALRKDPARTGAGIFLSPHSISTALAMTYAGARGATETEMAKALRFTLPQDRLHPAFDRLDLDLESRGKDAAGKDGQPFRLNVTNSTWGAVDMAFEAPFLDRLAVSYGTGVNLVDFRKAPEVARETINAWVEEETESRIKNLIPPQKLTKDTRLVLVNAVYFNAAWATKFDKSATADAPFTKLDGTTTTVSMMHASIGGRFVHAATYDAVEIPYDGGEMSMVVILPTGSFSPFEDSFTAADFRGVLDALAPAEMELALPKFREEGDFGLKQPLQSLGVRTAFDFSADFSGITTKEALLVDDVLHKTFLDIDESGTEAAAATAVIAGTFTAAVESKVKVTVDRPFLISIVDRATKTPVFFGRVLEPKK